MVAPDMALSGEKPVSIAGLAVILGAVGASVGLTLYGMGTSTVQTDPQLHNIGLILMVVGVILLAIGLVAMRATGDSTRS